MTIVSAKLQAINFKKDLNHFLQNEYHSLHNHRNSAFSDLSPQLMRECNETDYFLKVLFTVSFSSANEYVVHPGKKQTSPMIYHHLKLKHRPLSKNN